MKKVLKRTLATLLTVIMLFSALPLGVFAANESTVENETTAEIKQTNSLSKLLAEATDMSQVSMSSPYYISEMTFNGNTANVRYYNEQDCWLVVAVYDENTEQMLDSSITLVYAESITADVKMNIALPNHFIAKAFLLDENNAGLCKAYTCYDYTTESKELAEKTVDDFDEEQVINLDEEKDNNFAVLCDNVINIDSSSKVNTIYSMDVENNKYVITNIDSSVKNLKEGDMFYLDNGDVDNVVAIKINSITISGTKATIIAEDAEFEEIYEFIKIDATSSMGEADYSGEMADAEVEYLGDVEYDSEEAQFTLDSADANVNYTLSKKFKIEEKKYKNASGNIEGTFSGNVVLSAKIGFSATISKKFKEISFKIDPAFKIEVKAQGSIKALEIKLGSFGFSPVAGVLIGFEPVFTVKASSSISANCELKFTIGAGYNSKSGFVNKSTKPTLTANIKTEIELFVGVDLKPHAAVLSNHLAKITLSGLVGAETKTYNDNTAGSKEHSCSQCIKGEIDGAIKLSVKLTFGEDTFVETEHKATIIDIKIKIGNYYYSITHNDFGFGTCPYIRSASDGIGSNDSEFRGTEATGTIINFGSYPQSRVKDTVLINNLDGVTKRWKSYGYYIGTGNRNDGKMQPSDYMKYADFIYDGIKYRAVTFSQYRPLYTGYTSSASNTYQDDNGYYVDNIYYFKYEPLQWKVLDANTGLVMCAVAIDSQAFNNYVLYSDSQYYGDSSKSYYASDYGNSSLKEWLNDDFYNTAFSSEQQKKTNSVFLLSYEDVLNTSYGFSSIYSTSDTERQIKSTDYAKCQGCWQNTSTNYLGNSWWWLCSSYSSGIVRGVSSDGDVSDDYVHITDNSIVPAIKLEKSLFSADSFSETEIRLDEMECSTGTVDDINETFSISCSACVAGNDYILLNVLNYGDDFKLTTENLLYIDQLIADENGKVNTNFIPKYSINNSTTLIIGDFGNGIELKNYAQWVYDDLTPKSEKEVYYDSKKNIIYGYGLQKISSSELIGMFTNTNLLIDSTKTEKIATGTIISMKDDNGIVYKKTPCVIFGDVNGDGWYDGTDSIIVNCLANGILSREQVGEAVYMAADCNHDDVIDENDVALLEQAGLLLANVDQSKTPAELFEDAAFCEYINLITQSPVTAEKSVEKSTTDTTPVVTKTLIQKIIDFIIYIFKMITSYIPKAF